MGNTATLPIELQHTANVLTIALNRPQQHNALSPDLIGTLAQVFDDVGGNEEIRFVVLTGRGRSFCAGADLTYMQAAANYSFDENISDAAAIFDLMEAIDACPKPVIGRINGSAIGGGVGLVSCCDIAIAVERAQFAFSEARLGLVPAVISPFVLSKIGARFARELYLTGERFDARIAAQIGLVNHVVPDEATLDEKVVERIEQLRLAAPEAQGAAKALIREVTVGSREDMKAYTARLIAERRASDEGRSGMSSFLEKRKPDWQ